MLWIAFKFSRNFEAVSRTSSCLCRGGDKSSAPCDEAAPPSADNEGSQASAGKHEERGLVHSAIRPGQ